MALVPGLGTSLADYPPDPKNLEPADSEVIRLSGDRHAVVLRDGMGVVPGTAESLHPSIELFGLAGEQLLLYVRKDPALRPACGTLADPHGDTGQARDASHAGTRRVGVISCYTQG